VRTTANPPTRTVSADEAREVAEAAREKEWTAPSFVRELFLGTLRMDLIHPYPEQDPEEVRRAQPLRPCGRYTQVGIIPLTGTRAWERRCLRSVYRTCT
jgi:hypothetical protein